jgi:hypothetical protein
LSFDNDMNVSALPLLVYFIRPHLQPYHKLPPTYRLWDVSNILCSFRHTVPYHPFPRSALRGFLMRSHRDGTITREIFFPFQFHLSLSKRRILLSYWPQRRRVNTIVLFTSFPWKKKCSSPLHDQTLDFGMSYVVCRDFGESPDVGSYMRDPPASAR